MEKVPVEFGSFPERADRSRYIATRFAPFLKGRVLDVGCDRALLKQLVPGLDYTGIDVGGTPDLVVNLDRVGRIPFDDASFDCVVCADVLEHLDNLHHTFAELVRVARGSIILSLPNNWANARVPVERGRGRIGHYGLPVEPPVDRHKWFFSFSEAKEFLEGQCGKHPVTIRELFAMERRRSGASRVARRLLCRSHLAYVNRFAHTLWAVLDKRP
jgi:SAM-dependent methyltransferase